MTNTTPDYTIAPEDMDLARELSSFDPVRDAPSPVQVTGDVRLTSQLTASALPPALRQKVLAELAGVSLERRAEAEGRLVQKHLYENSYALRVRSGLGENATPLQREAFAIARETGDLQDEEFRIHAQLAEVERWETKFDEAIGKPTPVAVERVQGDRRKALEARLKQIAYHIERLNGPEGELRKQKALKASVEQEKARRQALADAAEVQRRAENLAREARINKAAEARARFMGPTNL